ncbi:MAG TPA: hypothetical protein DEG43_15660, partial [Acidimicrobiaceae bacterium]|nr:hypothetical protein [Acidimicrobiaceae bacterium]
GEQTRSTVLAAAISRFGRDGFRSTSVTDIAREAGVGGTVAYAYFENKEALFLAAFDEDVTQLMASGLASAESNRDQPEWQLHLFTTLLQGVAHHPLAGRVLAGLEPGLAPRLVDMPALQELRRVVGERIAAGQADGTVRSDIEPELVGNGVVALLLSLLVSVVQLGEESVGDHADAVISVFNAALNPIVTVAPVTR